MGFMQDKTSVYYRILEEICQEDGIDLAWLSSDWLAQLDKAGVRRRILGYKADLNPAASTLVADDKYATYEVLRNEEVPVIEHVMLYEAGNCNTYVEGRNTPEYIAEYFTKNNNHIVIKPNAGQCGRGISQITSLTQIPTVLEEVFKQSFSASMCPFYKIEHEYRVVMLDGEARLAYQKNRGNDWRFNLSQGATASQVTNTELLNRLIELAKRAVVAMGLRFCSVDIVEVAGDLMIIEINSGVTIMHYLEQFPYDYEKVKAIYRDVVQKMFAE